MAEPTVKLDSVLIVGGAGFVEYHITKCFLKQAKCNSIAVLSRIPCQDTIPACNGADAEAEV